MKTIYCISTGQYSDWKIIYAFKSIEKRDALLKVLGTEDYSDYDIELDDDGINISDIKEVYTFTLYKDYSNLDRDVITTPPNKMNIKTFHGLYSIELNISKEEFELGEEYCESKYRKVWFDTEAKIKYMYKVDRMSYYDIESVLNKES